MRNPSQPPTRAHQPSVTDGDEWVTATHSTSGDASAAAAHMSRTVASAKGQPTWRMNAITRGRSPPAGAGNGGPARPTSGSRAGAVFAPGRNVDAPSGLLLVLVELQRQRVHAVALPGRRRAVVEHVAEVRAAVRAQHLG